MRLTCDLLHRYNTVLSLVVFVSHFLAISTKNVASSTLTSSSSSSTLTSSSISDVVVGGHPPSSSNRTDLLLDIAHWYAAVAADTEKVNGIMFPRVFPKPTFKSDNTAQCALDVHYELDLHAFSTTFQICVLSIINETGENENMTDFFSRKQQNLCGSTMVATLDASLPSRMSPSIFAGEYTTPSVVPLSKSNPLRATGAGHYYFHCSTTEMSLHKCTNIHHSIVESATSRGKGYLFRRNYPLKNQLIGDVNTPARAQTPELFTTVLSIYNDLLTYWRRLELGQIPQYVGTGSIILPANDAAKLLVTLEHALRVFNETLSLAAFVTGDGTDDYEVLYLEKPITLDSLTVEANLASHAVLAAVYDLVLDIMQQFPTYLPFYTLADENNLKLQALRLIDSVTKWSGLTGCNTTNLQWSKFPLSVSATLFNTNKTYSLSKWEPQVAIMATVEDQTTQRNQFLTVLALLGTNLDTQCPSSSDLSYSEALFKSFAAAALIVPEGSSTGDSAKCRWLLKFTGAESSDPEAAVDASLYTVMAARALQHAYGNKNVFTEYLSTFRSDCLVPFFECRNGSGGGIQQCGVKTNLTSKTACIMEMNALPNLQTTTLAFLALQSNTTTLFRAASVRVPPPPTPAPPTPTPAPTNHKSFPDPIEPQPAGSTAQKIVAYAFLALAACVCMLAATRFLVKKGRNFRRRRPTGSGTDSGSRITSTLTSNSSLTSVDAAAFATPTRGGGPVNNNPENIHNNGGGDDMKSPHQHISGGSLNDSVTSRLMSGTHRNRGSFTTNIRPYPDPPPPAHLMPAPVRQVTNRESMAKPQAGPERPLVFYEVPGQPLIAPSYSGLRDLYGSTSTSTATTRTSTTSSRASATNRSMTSSFQTADGQRSAGSNSTSVEPSVSAFVAPRRTTSSLGTPNLLNVKSALKKQPQQPVEQQAQRAQHQQGRNR